MGAGARACFQGRSSGYLHGGQLLKWIDEEGGIHAGLELNTGLIVTKMISEIDFKFPVILGDVVEIGMQTLDIGKTSCTLSCEVRSLHADKVVAHAELYMGLVEFGVGLIPGGGGTKEFAKRLSDELHSGDIKINRLRDRFLTVGQAKVSLSAYEAFDYGYLREGVDEVVVSRAHHLTRAKAACLELAEKGYVAPKREKNVTVVGQEGLGIVYVGAHSMLSGNYMSEHDRIIAEKLGFVLCGGDLSENSTVSEQYLLDLERKAFLELCRERKTLERLESIVKYGKILRN